MNVVLSSQSEIYFQQFHNIIVETIWLPKPLFHIIFQYMTWVIHVGDFVDVQGTAAHLNMFVDASLRWELCRIIDINTLSGCSFDSPLLLVETVDRVHPYPYLYPGLHIYRAQRWLKMDQIQLPLSRSNQNETENVKEYDLVDVQNESTGEWKVAEVAANIGTSLWILFVDEYKDQNHKETLRKWILPEHLKPYRSMVKIK